MTKDLSDPAIQQTAMTLLSQYGDDAIVIATLRAAEIAALGDEAALAHWDGVIALLDSGPNADQLN